MSARVYKFETTINVPYYPNGVTIDQDVDVIVSYEIAEVLTIMDVIVGHKIAIVEVHLKDDGREWDLTDRQEDAIEGMISRHLLAKLAAAVRS